MLPVQSRSLQVFLSCPSFGLLHSAQIQVFFPIKEAIVRTPYSGLQSKAELTKKDIVGAKPEFQMPEEILEKSLGIIVGIANDY